MLVLGYRLLRTSELSPRLLALQDATLHILLGLQRRASRRDALEAAAAEAAELMVVVVVVVVVVVACAALTHALRRGRGWSSFQGHWYSCCQSESTQSKEKIRPTCRPCAPNASHNVTILLLPIVSCDTFKSKAWRRDPTRCEFNLKRSTESKMRV